MLVALLRPPSAPGAHRRPSPAAASAAAAAFSCYRRFMCCIALRCIASYGIYFAYMCKSCKTKSTHYCLQTVRSSAPDCCGQQVPWAIGAIRVFTAGFDDDREFRWSTAHVLVGSIQRCGQRCSTRPGALNVAAATQLMGKHVSRSCLTLLFPHTVLAEDRLCSQEDTREGDPRGRNMGIPMRGPPLLHVHISGS